MRLLNPKKNSTLYKLEQYVQKPHFLVFLLLAATLPITLAVLYQQQNFHPEASLIVTENDGQDTDVAAPTIPPEFAGEVDTISPEITIRHPVNGKQVFEKTFLSILTLATDNIGVTRIEVRINGETICAHNGDKSVCKWQVPEGRNMRYVITTRAFDFAGNTNSKAVEIITR